MKITVMSVGTSDDFISLTDIIKSIKEMIYEYPMLFNGRKK